ncbi:hypothetical protein VHUM_01870 [Vanrija humicola]|uniref:Autophagy-related protein 101 n=1 Tax=Vanrija humicola TaxID=5417 RepID=A0A7D8Z4A6_VANHU|nr:hypothetical protein VHUM_01870 [Vanrija humicola]
MEAVNHIKLVRSVRGSSQPASHPACQRLPPPPLAFLSSLPQRVERTQAKPVLSALLHAVFFHRLLDAVEPETVETNETHVACGGGGGGVEREIAARVDEFGRTFVDQGSDSGEIGVVFLQRKNRKGWFAVTEALVPWEEHLITIHFVKRATTNPLPGALLQLLTFCAERKDNVPPLVGTSVEHSSRQILISPPPPSELFAPSSPPLGPTRLTSPPPAPVQGTTPATALADIPRAYPAAPRSTSLGPRAHDGHQ